MSRWCVVVERRRRGGRRGGGASTARRRGCRAPGSSGAIADALGDRGRDDDRRPRSSTAQTSARRSGCRFMRGGPGRQPRSVRTGPVPATLGLCHAPRMADAVPEMRQWGLPDPGELDSVVIVSPHLDDAVLGCGRLMAAHPGATVVTLYAGAPAAYPDPMTHWDTLAGFVPGDDVLAPRREEDAAALGRARRHAVLARLRRAPVPAPRPSGSGPTRPSTGSRRCCASWRRPRCSCRSGSRTPTTPPPTRPGCSCASASPSRRGSVTRTRATSTSRACSPGGCPSCSGAGSGRRRSRSPSTTHDARKRAALDCYRSQLLALEADWQLGPEARRARAALAARAAAGRLGGPRRRVTARRGGVTRGRTPA